MDSNNSTSTNSLPKKTRERSAAYPNWNLEQVIDATRSLREQLGSGPFSRESAAIALGYSGLTGSSSSKIAACVHFGLLTKSGNTYSPSELSQRIFTFITQDERRSALLEALRSPKLYKRLIDRYEGQSLPLMLNNILTREYGITEKASDDAASIFKKSAEFAGILRNGVLSTNLASDEEDITQKEEIPQGESNAQTISDDNISRNLIVSFGKTTYLSPMDVPGTEIKIIFPIKYAGAVMMGEFKDGVEKLAENANSQENNNDTQEAETEQ